MLIFLSPFDCQHLERIEILPFIPIEIRWASCQGSIRDPTLEQIDQLIVSDTPCNIGHWGGIHVQDACAFPLQPNVSVHHNDSRDA